MCNCKECFESACSSHKCILCVLDCRRSCVASVSAAVDKHCCVVDRREICEDATGLLLALPGIVVSFIANRVADVRNQIAAAREEEEKDGDEEARRTSTTKTTAATTTTNNDDETVSLVTSRRS